MNHGCDGKEQFLNLETANTVCSRINKRKPKRRVNVYKCKECGYYHVGSYDK